MIGATGRITEIQQHLRKSLTVLHVRGALLRVGFDTVVIHA